MKANTKHLSLKDKRIVYINLGNYGSTGKIIYDISALAESDGAFTFRCYPEETLNVDSKDKDYIISHNLYLKINRKLAVYTGMNGRFNVSASLRLVRFLDRLKPDLVHLHNLHNSYINLSILFNYIRKRKIKVVWTLHDCWAFTGHCAHYTMVKCDKWLDGCERCEHYSDYPYGLFDNARKVFKFKKRTFCGIDSLMITVPSQWLLSQVKQSFLNEYDSKVINNGIDTTLFKPGQDKFVNAYNLSDKKIILGVSFDWTIKKGIDVFLELSGVLPDQYRIVLVGQCNDVDLPDSIIHIDRTENREELADIYSSAYVFVNPTREEVFGLVNAEALSCGTPVISFNTGGSPEILDDSCGLVCEVNNCKSVLDCLEKLNKNYPSKKDCRARGLKFDYRSTYTEYMNLYQEILG